MRVSDSEYSVRVSNPGLWAAVPCGAEQKRWVKRSPANQLVFRHSSSKLALKDSTSALSASFPRSAEVERAWCRYAHFSTALDTNLGLMRGEAVMPAIRTLEMVGVQPQILVLKEKLGPILRRVPRIRRPRLVTSRAGISGSVVFRLSDTGSSAQPSHRTGHFAIEQIPST